MLQNIISIWKQFYDLHCQLYQATCKEYQLLLQNQVDTINMHLKNKIDLINKIKKLELKRKDLLRNLPGINNISDLLDYAQSQDLEEYNNRLIDIIDKIQEQNKKNQIFINKAIYNLRNIRDEILGYCLSSSYDSRGRLHEKQEHI